MLYSPFFRSSFDPNNSFLCLCLEMVVQSDIKDFLKSYLLTKDPKYEENIERCVEIVDTVENAIREIADKGPGVKRRCTEAYCASASKFGDLSNWKENTEKLSVCCHLPTYSGGKVHGLHVTLIVEAFGKFCDTLKERNPPPDKFVALAARLLIATSDVFSEEVAYVSKVAPLLSESLRGLGVDLSPQSTVGQSASKSNKTDRTILFNSIELGNFEFKKDINSGKSNPCIQNIAYFIKLKQGIAGTTPMLLIAMSGFSFMQVFGAAWNGDDLCVDPLSHPVPLLFVPSDPTETVSAVARMLHAIYVGIRELKVYYTDLSAKHIRGGPYYILSKEIKQTKNLQSKENCFEGMYNNSPVVVKFARSYGKLVQDTLSKIGLAPKILRFNKLPGGWIAVVMEKIQGEQQNLTKKTVELLKKKVVEELHKKNFVHGDLRRPNLFVTQDRVFFLDFDWAGEEGVVRYPGDLNVDIDWPAGVVPGGLISKDHDTDQVQKLIDSVKD